MSLVCRMAEPEDVAAVADGADARQYLVRIERLGEPIEVEVEASDSWRARVVAVRAIGDRWPIGATAEVEILLAHGKRPG